MKKLDDDAGLLTPLLKAALDSSAEGIMILQFAGEVVTINRRFAEIWRIPPELFSRCSKMQILEFVSAQVKDSARFLARETEASTTTTSVLCDIVELNDGRTFERSVFPQCIEGKNIGVITNWRDVSERKQTEVILTEERKLLRTLIDSLPVYLYLKDTAGHFLLCNAQHTYDLGLSMDQIIGKTVFDLYPVELACGYDIDDQAVIRTGRPLVREDPGEINGVRRWFSTTKVPLRDSSGNITGLIGVSLDITDRKQAEEEREILHRQLEASCRQAGMAEVATGVLHNVGNVLNSVNVSATLVAERVQHTKAGNIAKIAELFDQHKADLVGFLTVDSRGKMIPGYMSTLAAMIASEQKSLLTELDQLRKDIEHIKDIVAMQQAYARTSGVTETVSVPDLIEDGLRINASSLARHDVDVRRDYQVRPVITTDKHKVMQILINLVRNAKHACDESGRVDKQITVRTTSNEVSVKIAIIDNGIGIPAENLTRIFSHGFTTRATGHGFGLHSAAIAARELGGSLTAQSGGLGQGATFVLELPHKAVAPVQIKP